jgi:hypothetical protein
VPGGTLVEMRLKSLVYKSIAMLLIFLFSFFLTISVARAEEVINSETTPPPEQTSDQQQEPDLNTTPTLEQIQSIVNSSLSAINQSIQQTETAIESIIDEKVGADSSIETEAASKEEVNQVIVMITETKSDAEFVIQQAQALLQEAQQIKEEIDGAVIVSPGLTVTVYNNLGQNASPSIPGDDKIVYTTTVSSINEQWGSGPVAGSNLSEDVVVKYEGNITSDISGTIYFYAPGDDGVRLYINGELIINDWVDKGGGGSVSTGIEFEAGTSQTIVMYYYENGGGAWVQLYWDQGNGFEIVTDTAFNVIQPDEQLQSALTEELNTTIATLVEIVNQIQLKVEQVIVTNNNAISQIQVIYTPPVPPAPEPPVVPINPEPNQPSEPIQPEPQPEPDPLPVEPTPEPEPEQEEPKPPIEDPKDPEPEVPQDPEPPLEEEDPKEDSGDKPEPVVPDTNNKDPKDPVQEKPQAPVEPISPQNPPNNPPSQNTIVLPNGVVLPADVAKALELVSSNPIELLNNILENPAEALKALLNIGADMSPEKREEAQIIVIAAIIIGQIMATVAAAVQMSQSRRN